MRPAAGFEFGSRGYSTLVEPVAVALAVLAALANATASVLQRRAGAGESDDRALSVRAALNQVRQPVWRFGVLAILVGFATQALALALGSIAVVQPVLVVELPFTVLLAAMVFRARPRRSEWLAIAALTLGLAVFIACLAPEGGDPSRVSAPAWLVGLVCTLGLGSGAVLLGRASSGHRRAALLGVATGTGFGLTAVFTSAAAAAAGHGVLALLGAWPTYAVLLVGPASFVLLQSSLRAGSLIASQPALTLTNPIVAGAWGVVAFHDRVCGGRWLAGAVLGALLIAEGALLIAEGMLLLARSPLLSGSRPSSRTSL